MILEKNEIVFFQAKKMNIIPRPQCQEYRHHHHRNPQNRQDYVKDDY